MTWEKILSNDRSLCMLIFIIVVKAAKVDIMALEVPAFRGICKKIIFAILLCIG